jgi:predicted acylesterase/phospholipase RssA
MADAVSRRALVLSGGGGRGAYQIGALTYLQRVGWRPDMLVGTSIGAVNAAALGSGLPLEGLRERWLDLETGDVQKMRADDVFVDNMLMQRTHMFDTDPLLSTIAGTSSKWHDRPWIYPEILNGEAAPYDVWITAVDKAEHQLVTFSNRSREGILPRMVQASCSIPLWYEPTTFGGRTYVDGGVISNTPFRKALVEGATEIVVVMMAPWPGCPAQSWDPGRRLPGPGDELLKIPQDLWSAFEPALDMMLTEIVWRDYLLLEAERRLGEHPQLKWIRFVAPVVPLPVGNMTLYHRDNHIRLFRLGERHAHQVLSDVCDLDGVDPDSGEGANGCAR